MDRRSYLNRLTEILMLVKDALEDAGYPVSNTTIEPGEPAWSYCCDDGHAYIRTVRMHMVEPFPNQTLNTMACQNIGALLAVGVLRCGPTLGPDGDVPEPTEVTDMGILIATDATIVHNALADHRPNYANFPLAFDNYTPLGPAGGCYGGEWQFWADVSMCLPTSE